MTIFAFPLVALIVIAVLALVLTALISAGIAALLRVTRTGLADALEDAVRQNRPAGRIRRIQLAQSLAADPPMTISGLAILRTMAQTIAIGSLTLVATKIVPLWWQALLLVAILSVAVGIVLARFGPRQLGFRRPVRVLTRLAPMLTAIAGATRWATITSPRHILEDQTEDTEYREIVDRVEESSGIEEDERELIRSVFEFRDTLAREIMVPRTEMVTAPATIPLRKVMRLMLRSGFSRVPLTGSSVDDLKGIVYLKDVAQAIEADPLAGDRPASQYAREAQYIPESKPVDDLLRELQTAATHIAIVVDEYGGIAGLLTIEDIIEELVGELIDEHDSVRYREPEEVSPGIWRVPARMPVDELGELFDMRLEDDDVDTVGGLLAKALGKVPIAGSEGDIVGLNLVADQVEGRRRQVATILVSRTVADGANGRIPQ